MSLQAFRHEQMLTDLIQDLTGRVNEDLPPFVLRAMSVDVQAFRSKLDKSGLCYVDGSQEDLPDLDALRRAADSTIRSSVRRASIAGAASGMGGWLGVPPEIASRVVQSVRLAQRLAIIYGHDPQTDRGAMHVRKALAAGWQFDLPNQAKVDIKISDLPKMVQNQLQPTQHAGGWMAHKLLRKATASIGSRFGRVVPGLGAGLGAYQASRATRALGDRMRDVYIRLHRIPKPTRIEDAIEV